MKLGVFNEEKQRAMVSYEVAFEKDFDFVLGAVSLFSSSKRG
jgi:hypothetical protein